MTTEKWNIGWLSSFTLIVNNGLREYPGLTYLPLIDCPYPVRYYAIYKKNNKNPHIQKLIDTIKTFF